MALSPSELAALKSSLSYWECFEYAATALVLLGVIGEFVAEFTQFAQRRQLEKRIVKISTLVLIVGLAAELLGLVQVTHLSGQLIASLESQAGQATRDAALAQVAAAKFESSIADANARAKVAEADVAVANAGAAEARRIAGHEQLERVRLESGLVARDVSVMQQRAIGDSLRRGYSGKSVTVSSFVIDTEGGRLALMIKAALELGGLTVTDEIGRLVPVGPATVGALVEGPEGQRDLMMALQSALKTDGNLAMAPIKQLADPRSVVRITVGVKPFLILNRVTR